MKKPLILLTTTASALTLSGCCFFMSPPPKPAAVAPAAVKAPPFIPTPAPIVVAPVPPPPADSDQDGIIDTLDQCPDTKAGLAVDSKGCPPPIEENVKIVIGVLFASGKADINESSTEDIKDLGVFMQTYPTTTTVIEGHTDNVGSAALNKALSQRRAEAVREYLIKNYSIDPNRLKAVGYGFERPVADNSTAEGRKLNRRTEAAIETTVIKPQQ